MGGAPLVETGVTNSEQLQGRRRTHGRPIIHVESGDSVWNEAESNSAEGKEVPRATGAPGPSLPLPPYGCPRVGRFRSAHSSVTQGKTEHTPV